MPSSDQTPTSLQQTMRPHHTNNLGERNLSFKTWTSILILLQPHLHIPISHPPFHMLCSSHTQLPPFPPGCSVPCSHRWWQPLQTQTCCNWLSCCHSLGSQPCCPADWTSDRPPCISHACCSHGRWPPGSSRHPQRSCHRRSGRRHHSQCGGDTGHLQREPARDPLSESTGSISDSQPERLWEVRNVS